MPETNPNPQVSLLLYMLEDVRKVLLEGVSHLTKEQLFTPPIKDEYCIGSYLMHLAECDLGWLATISGEQIPYAIKKKCFYGNWFDPDPDFKDDYSPPSDALEPAEYFETIGVTRQMFIDHISTLTDADLETVITRGTRSFTKKWIIYHLIEHEAHTRGQMFMLIRMAGWKKT